MDALTDQYRRGPVAVNVVVVAVMAVAFAWRRRVPLLFVLVVGLAADPAEFGAHLCPRDPGRFLLRDRPDVHRRGLADPVMGRRGIGVLDRGSIGVGVVGHKPAAGVAGGLVMSCLLWAAGRLWRSQRVLAERVAETHTLLAAEREDRERLAIASERARIARELHTEVAQGVVAMIVQAAAARCAIGDDPAAATDAITAIEQAGRAALARMRDILGVLRARHDLLQVRPQPGVGQLHAMIQQLRDDGRSVELASKATRRRFPPGST